MTALVWSHRAPRGVRGLLPEPLAGRPWLPLGLGGVVLYHDGPVGPYNEIFATALAPRLGPPVAHVPFMAVDLAASVAAGRVNWALPKVLAHFEAAPHPSPRLTARGDDWAVAVKASVRDRRLPLRGRGTCVQWWPDQRLREFSVRLRCEGRLATVWVEHLRPSPTAAWLPAGRHPGMLVSGRLEVMAPARVTGERAPDAGGSEGGAVGAALRHPLDTGPAP